jgi:hypothetical protein
MFKICPVKMQARYTIFLS